MSKGHDTFFDLIGCKNYLGILVPRSCFMLVDKLTVWLINGSFKKLHTC